MGDHDSGNHTTILHHKGSQELSSCDSFQSRAASIILYICRDNCTHTHTHSIINHLPRILYAQSCPRALHTSVGTQQFGSYADMTCCPCCGLVTCDKHPVRGTDRNVNVPSSFLCHPCHVNSWYTCYHVHHNAQKCCALLNQCTVYNVCTQTDRQFLCL